MSLTDQINVTCLNRRLQWLFGDTIFDCAFTAKTKNQSVYTVLSRLFLLALKQGLVNLMEWLLCHIDRLDLNGTVRKSFNSTFLQLSSLEDTPRIRKRRAMHRTGLDSDLGDYSDLTPIYKTLAHYLICSPRAFDTALRIACTYALPKTARLLLTLGADPNILSRIGLSALHSAVARPWPWFRNRSIESWDAMVEETVKTLLFFNADFRVQTKTPYSHTCGPSCWKSIDCDSSGQTALQLAVGSDLRSATIILLDNGADPNSSNEDGFRVLYTALCQGNSSIATILLDRLASDINPIVRERDGMTALHAACRFAVSEIVHLLLKRGADTNAIDSCGRTPLHEVLSQTQLAIEHRVIETLHHLDEFGADPDIKVGIIKNSSRMLAQSHPSPSVRSIFITMETEKRKGRLHPPNQGSRETRNTPPVKPPPKIPMALPTGYLPQLKGSWASSDTKDIIQDLRVSASVLDEDEPQLTQENFPLLNNSGKSVPSEISKEAPVGSRENKKDQGPLSVCQDCPSSQRPDAAAQFWKDLPKQRFPKVEACQNNTNTGCELDRRQTTGKARTRKTKWTPLQI
ncbi:ankyrin [Jackrogersella minutella]|nr:ankyrin [Jackrogersella minutella]